METKHTELYEAPTMEVVEVKYEGFICASGDLDTTFNAPFEEEQNW